MNTKIPPEIKQYLQQCLIGEIYHHIRAIAVSLSAQKMMLIRYYLDRKPTLFDYESADVFAFNFSASFGEPEVMGIGIECEYSDKLLNHLDGLDGFIYARREYEMEDVNTETYPSEEWVKDISSPVRSFD